jgi:hypothetical protein
MEMLSAKYGWTPSQIRAERAEDIGQYVEIISMQNRINKANAARRDS